MAVHLEEPGLDRFKIAGNPIKIAGVPDPDTRPAAPALDANRAALIAEFELG